MQTEPIIRDSRRASAAKLVRRATMATNRSMIEDLSALASQNQVAAIMNTAEITAEPPVTLGEDDNQGEAVNEMVSWWMQRMSEPSIGERMAWFWHTILTTHRSDAHGFEFLKKQLTLIRSNAMGNYRTLLQGFVVDGSLLAYLDGDGSRASNPNENLARELMELFTLGVGNYTEGDVASAARALAGWRVNREDGEVFFDRERAFIAPLLIRGEQKNWDTESLVDALCDDVQTATYIGRQVWFYLGGGWLDDSDSKRLGRWWHSKDYEIAPLVERALTDAIDAPDYQRPKQGLEFYLSYAERVNLNWPEPNYRPNALGQVPYEPPNVAGWPTDDRWLAPGQMLVRGQMAHYIDFDRVDDWQSITKESALDLCSLYNISPATEEAISQLDRSEISEEPKAKAYLTAALASPEFQLI